MRWRIRRPELVWQSMRQDVHVHCSDTPAALMPLGFQLSRGVAAYLRVCAPGAALCATARLSIMITSPCCHLCE